MNEYIEIISQLKPKNNRNFPLADVNDLKGGYIQVDTIAEMEAFLLTTKLKEGMLCYVKNDLSNRHMYQYLRNTWVPWSYTSEGSPNGTGGGSIQVLTYLSELDSPDHRITGQIVFIKESDDIRYYNGTVWKSFSKIYIQDVPPEDKGGIWIDTSEEKQYLESNTVIQNLLQVISILQDKVSKLEWAFKSQIDFGDFSNNKRHEYDGYTGMEPQYGLSEEEELAELTENLKKEVLLEQEPIQYKDGIPNATHLCIKSGTYADMVTNQEEFLPKELLWCYDKKQLWIKDPKTLKLIQIGSSYQGGDEEPIDETMEQILLETIGQDKKIVGIEFADMNNKDNTYIVQVANGELEVLDKKLLTKNLAGNAQKEANDPGYYSTPYFPIIPALVGATTSPKIHINMVYTGGKNTEHDFVGSSHNFIELCNLGNTDLNLKGLYLHYTEGEANLNGTRNWVTLPLIGTLKSRGTFLIRGAQCSFMDVNTTLLKVSTFDMEWKKSITKHSDRLEIYEDIEAGVQGRTIWDSNELIRFNPTCAFYLSGSETDTTFDDDPFTAIKPYNNKSGIKWYIDMVGIGPSGTPAEGSPLSSFSVQNVHMRYFNMDPVSQATKAFNARDNSKDWMSVSLVNPPKEYNMEDLRPRASFENKFLFFNKDLLKEGPQLLNCTLGYDGHKTRCFNWVSKGYYDEFIQIVKEEEEFTETLGTDMFESFKEGDGRTDNKHWNNKIYNRIRERSTDGTAFTVHKFIKDFTEPVSGETVVYKYKSGRPGFWTPVKTFTLRNRDDVRVNGFNFLHVTDEQGFVEEEYETVKLTSEFIKKDSKDNNYNFDFIVNSGDITQNGNRLHEWINYFNNREEIFNDKEVMYTVGNNDLCPADIHEIGIDPDWGKCNPINITYFFTFEHPFGIPQSSSGHYIPSIYSYHYGDTFFLVMNSEITDVTIKDVLFQDVSQNIYTDTIKAWCDNEIAQLTSNPGINWRVSMTHEAPFTLLTAEIIIEYVNSTTFEVNPDQERGGSHLNTIGNYWYSKFLEENKFNLNLCGHKHTFTNSRYLRENPLPQKTMAPIIYDSEYDPILSQNPAWFNNLPNREQKCCELSNDTNVWYVKYVMNQATGYKLVSNKESPAQNIPWLLEYYPVTKQIENADKTVAVTPNAAQQFPHYILWNIGKGTEVENPSESVTERARIKGSVYRILKKSTSTNVSWPLFKYSSRASLSDLYRDGGNGVNNKNNNIIVEKLFT